MKIFLCGLLCFVIILGACAPMTMPQATPTVILVAPSLTKQPPTMTATLPPPTETPTLLPTATLPPATRTPLPTLAPDQAEARVAELLKTNNGCKLPCFWGITPGQTSWDDAKSFLETFSSRTSGSDLVDSRFVRDIYFALNDNTDVDLDLTLTIDHNLVQEISIGDFDAPSYHLAQFLANNGAPDQIWVLTFSEFAGERGPGVGANIVPFSIYLFYKDAKMIVAYGRGQGIVKDDQITDCIEGSPSLYIWALDKSLTFLEAAQLGHYYQPEYAFTDKYLEISDATQGKLNAKKFFETFNHPGAKACFQTPKELWPAG